MAAVLFPFVLVMFAVFTRNNALSMLYFYPNKKRISQRILYYLLN